MFSSDSQPKVGASVKYSSTRTMPDISMVVPTMSTLLFSPGTSFLRATKAMKNKIMLKMKAEWKAHCQLKSCTMYAPMIKPAAAPMAKVPLIMPCAVATFSLGKTSVIMAKSQRNYGEADALDGS